MVNEKNCYGILQKQQPCPVRSKPKVHLLKSSVATIPNRFILNSSSRRTLSRTRTPQSITVPCLLVAYIHILKPAVPFTGHIPSYIANIQHMLHGVVFKGHLY